MTRKIVCFLTIGTIAILCVGCGKREPPKTTSQLIQTVCIEACQQARAAGQDLSQGPCLLDPVSQNPNWVCDIAHSPRQPIDNLPQNQCQTFRQGKAHHFIELTPDCQLLTVH